MNKDLLAKYELVVGVESHIELRTDSKMFCGCAADHFGQKANTQCCPVCLGLPGAMPVPNKKAMDWTIKLALALNCKINYQTHFDRKNYSYPDLAKGYQLTQNERPFGENGWVEITLPSGQTKKIHIRRVHLEEDTAKLQHQQINGKNVTLIDFNRSGVPLVEIVTTADINSPLEAKLYLTKLRNIARYLGVSTTDMEKGAMRMEPNISVRQAGSTELPNYKVEVKNINSFRFVEQAIEFEFERHVKMLEAGQVPVQETRGWDLNQGVTRGQRTKENAGDYRYFPDPDIPPMEYTSAEIEKLATQLPVSLDERFANWQSKYDLSIDYVQVLLQNFRSADILEEVFAQANAYDVTAKQVASALVNKNVSSWLHEAQALVASADEITQEKERVLQAVQELYTYEEIDTAEIEKIIREILEQPQNLSAVEDYRGGKKQAIGFLLGQLNKALGGKADMNEVRQLLLKIL